MSLSLIGYSAVQRPSIFMSLNADWKKRSWPRPLGAASAGPSRQAIRVQFKLRTPRNVICDAQLYAIDARDLPPCRR